MTKKIENIFSNINNNEFATENDLSDLRDIEKNDLFYMFSNINKDVKGYIYLLKCYLTVLNMDVLESVYIENKELVERGLAKLYVVEIKKEKEDDIILAYLPLIFFDTKILTYFRRGLHKFFPEEVFDYDLFILSLVKNISKNKDFVVSRIMFNNLDRTNDEAIKLIQSEDGDLARKLERIKNNLILSFRLIDYLYINDKVEFKRMTKLLKSEIAANYDNYDFEVIESIFSYDSFESINSSLKIKKPKLLSRFKKQFNQKEKIEPIKSEPDIKDFLMDESVESFSVDNDEIIIEEQSALFMDKESAPVESLKNDDIEIKRNSNRFKVDYEKKESNIKVIILAIAIIMISFFTAYKMMSSEMQRENGIRDDINHQPVSEIETTVNLIKPNET